jgi:hypothetical protein
MRRPSRLVLETQRHLKWRSLDHLEAVTMVLCGLCLAGFSTSVFLDVLTRTLAAPWLWLQEVTSTFFVYGIFIGAAAATRRNDHLYLSAITEAMTGAPQDMDARLVREVSIPSPSGPVLNPKAFDQGATIESQSLFLQG